MTKFIKILFFLVSVVSFDVYSGSKLSRAKKPIVNSIYDLRMMNSSKNHEDANSKFKIAVSKLTDQLTHEQVIAMSIAAPQADLQQDQKLSDLLNSTDIFAESVIENSKKVFSYYVTCAGELIIIVEPDAYCDFRVMSLGTVRIVKKTPTHSEYIFFNAKGEITSDAEKIDSHVLGFHSERGLEIQHIGNRSSVDMDISAHKITFLSKLKIKAKDVISCDSLHNLKNVYFESSANLKIKERLENKGEMHFNSDCCLALKCLDNYGFLVSKKKIFLTVEDFLNPRALLADKIESGGIKIHPSTAWIGGHEGTALIVMNHFDNTHGIIGKKGDTFVTALPNVNPEMNMLGTIQGDRVFCNFKNPNVKLLKGKFIAKQCVQCDVPNGLVLGDLNFKTPTAIFSGASLSFLNPIACPMLCIKMAAENFAVQGAIKMAGKLKFIEKECVDADGNELPEVRAQTPPTRNLNFTHNIKADGGVSVTAPHSAVTVGDLSTPTEIVAENGNVNFNVGSFDQVSGLIAGLDGEVIAPFGIKTGRLVEDPTKAVFSTIYASHHNLHSHNIGQSFFPTHCTRNGEPYSFSYDGVHLLRFPHLLSNQASMLFRNKLKMEGPWATHHGFIQTQDMCINSPVQTRLTAGSINIKGDCEFENAAGMMIGRETVNLVGQHRATHWQVDNINYQFVASDPGELIVGGQISGKMPVSVTNQGGVLHFGSHSNVNVQSHNLYSTLFQQIMPLSELNQKPIHPDPVWRHFRVIKVIRNRSNANSVFGSHVAGAAIQFLATNDYFQGAQNYYPPITSSVSSYLVPASVQSIQGHLSTGQLVVQVGENNIVIGTPGLRPLHRGPALANLSEMRSNAYVMSDQGPYIRTQIGKPNDPRVFFLQQDRFWFDYDQAQRFYHDMADSIYVINPEGKVQRTSPAGQAFSYAPSQLIDKVRDFTIATLHRGFIEFGKNIDAEMIAELHQNMQGYVKAMGIDSVSAGLSKLNPAYLPPKPVIFYKALRNQYGYDELCAHLYFPASYVNQAQGIGGTKLLAENILIVPASMNVQKMLLVPPEIQSAEHMMALVTAIKFSKTRTPRKTGTVTVHGSVEATQNAMVVIPNEIYVDGEFVAENLLLASLFSDVRCESLVQRQNLSNGHKDRVLQQARLIARNLLGLYAGNNIEFIGAQTKSVRTCIKALGDVLDIPVTLVEQHVEQIMGKKKSMSEVTTIRQTHLPSSHQFQEMTSESGGQTVLAGTQLIGQKAHISAVQGIVAPEVHDGVSVSEVNTKRNKTIFASSHSSTSSGITANVGHLTLASEAGVRLENPAVRGTRMDVIAPIAAITAGRAHQDTHAASDYRGRVWNKQSASSSSSTSYSAPQLDTEVHLDADNAYLENIRKTDVIHTRPDTQVTSVQLQNTITSTHTVQRQLAGPARAAIMLAMSIATAGSSLGASVASSLHCANAGVASAITMGVNSAVTTIASQVAVDSIERNPLQAARNIFKGRNLKRLVTNVATSAVSAGIAQRVGLTAKSAEFADRLKREVLNGSVAAIFETILQGGQFNRNLMSEIKQAGIKAISGHAAQTIGDAQVKGELNFFTHKVLHAIVGGLAAELENGDFVSGAVAAAVAETVSELYLKKQTSQDDDDDASISEIEESFDLIADLDQQVEEKISEDDARNITFPLAERAAKMGRFVSLAVAFGFDHDIQSAGHAAANAVENNLVAHAVIGACAVAGTAYSAYEIYHAYVNAGGGEAGAIAALKELGFEVVMTVAGAVVLKSGIQIAKPVGEILRAEIAKTPLLRYAFERAERLVADGLRQVKSVAAKTQNLVEEKVAKIYTPKVKEIDWQKAARGAEEAADAGFAVGTAGAAKVWTKRGRLKAAQLPTEGKIRFIPRKGYKPSERLPKGENNGYFDNLGNEWTKGPSRTYGEAFEWDVQLSDLGRKHLGWASRDGRHLNVSLKGKITH